MTDHAGRTRDRSDVTLTEQARRASNMSLVAVLVHSLVPRPVPGTKGMTRNVYVLILDAVSRTLLLPGPSHFLGKSPIQVLGLGTELWRVNPMYACVSVRMRVCIYVGVDTYLYVRSDVCMHVSCLST